QTKHQPAVHPFGLLGTITQKIVNRFLELPFSSETLFHGQDQTDTIWFFSTWVLRWERSIERFFYQATTSSSPCHLTSLA
nr:hypothetical protein [Xanthomonas campestris pv. campestris]